MMRNLLLIPALVLCCVPLAAGQGQTPAPSRSAARPTPPRPAAPDAAAIVAVVNGDVISQGDVDNRRRLFAMSTGMPSSPEVLDRLTPQVTRQLIDERLRLQEVQRRKVVVSDQEIADAIGEVESRNNMPAGTLRRRLAADNVELRTLVDQIRVQIGWTRVLRQALAGTFEVTPADIAEQERQAKEQVGKPEYHVAEIFVPIADPARAEDAQRFADTVIQQLRAGAPFPVVAAQFSQSQTALRGGDLGWVDPTQIDRAVLNVLGEMPVGAISNPVRVPGGISIVTLAGKRESGRDIATILHMRQVFFPFATRLDPQNPTAQQKQVLEQTQRLSASAKTCDAMDEANKSSGSGKPADPGDVRLETIGSPAMRQLLATLPEQKASQPLVAEDGIAVVMVCGREQKNLASLSKDEITDKLINQRVELTSRQLQRDLERRAVIDQRS